MVGVIMGSSNDLDIMNGAIGALKELDIPFESRIISAHRAPLMMAEYAISARANKFKVIIAGAGCAAHLPGMVASYTNVPVIGVPLRSKDSLDGWDSILSILQMPLGIPVATVALNGAWNAGILAAQMIAIGDPIVYVNLERYRQRLLTTSKSGERP